jgi:UDP-N-acetyl-D-glucosamine dehydrogenase
VDPGNAEHTTRTIPKVVGGVGPASTEAAAALYALVVSVVGPVSSTRVAEMVKLLENTFRAVNIALVNEIALMCHKMGIGVWEVIDAAETKPFGFMPFYPGPGLGGHCIPIDPFYLSWKARQDGFESRFIALAGEINAAMPEHVVERVSEALAARGRSLSGARVHLFGVAYKRNVGDVRESPALDILELLTRRGAVVSYTDPHVASVSHGGSTLDGVPFAAAVASPYDCAVVATDHDAFDYARIAAMPLVVDTRNALKGFDRASILRL